MIGANVTVENQAEPPEPIKINVGDAVKVGIEVPKVKLLRYSSFAREWFENASKQAKEKDNPQAVRREIIFAVCLVESYIYEWVRDEVLDDKDPDTIQPFFDFPSELDQDIRGQEQATRKRKAGIKERWKTVIDRLERKGKIKEKPDWGESKSWDDFIKLVKLRDELVHAGASRAETSNQPESERSFPTMDDLQKTSNGWATEIVVALISELHQAVGTSSPEWLIYP